MSEPPKESPTAAYHLCPTCGSTLLVAHSDEGTGSFMPLDARQIATLQADRDAWQARFESVAKSFDGAMEDFYTERARAERAEASLLDLRDILLERDRLIITLTVEYRAAQKQLAVSPAREAALREALARIVAGSIRSRPQAAIDELREIARDALAAEPGQAAEQVQAVVEAAREWKRHTDTLYGPPREWWDSAPRRLYEAVAALAAPGKGEGKEASK